jgi:hypothetical protein
MRSYHSFITLSIGAVCLVSHSFSQIGSDPEAVALLTAVSTRMHGIDQSSLITMTQTDRRDTVRTRQFRVWIHYAQPADSIQKQSCVHMIKPDISAGHKIWSWTMSRGQTRRWLYLPGSGKVREISRNRGSRSQDLDLSELELTRHQINSHTSTIVDRPIQDGRELILIRSVEREDPDESRSRRRERKPDYKLLWIDPLTLLIRQVEFYSSRDRLRKRYRVERTQVLQGLELAISIRVWDAKQKRETLIALSELSLDPITDRRIFQPSTD